MCNNFVVITVGECSIPQLGRLLPLRNDTKLRRPPRLTTGEQYSTTTSGIYIHMWALCFRKPEDEFVVRRTTTYEFVN